MLPPLRQICVCPLIEGYWPLQCAKEDPPSRGQFLVPFIETGKIHVKRHIASTNIMCQGSLSTRPAGKHKARISRQPVTRPLASLDIAGRTNRSWIYFIVLVLSSLPFLISTRTDLHGVILNLRILVTILQHPHTGHEIIIRRTTPLSWDLSHQKAYRDHESFLNRTSQRKSKQREHPAPLPPPPALHLGQNPNNLSFYRHSIAE
jgi:hypothetical protein